MKDILLDDQLDIKDLGGSESPRNLPDLTKAFTTEDLEALRRIIIGHCEPDISSIDSVYEDGFYYKILAAQGDTSKVILDTPDTLREAAKELATKYIDNLGTVVEVLAQIRTVTPDFFPEVRENVWSAIGENIRRRMQSYFEKRAVGTSGSVVNSLVYLKIASPEQFTHQVKSSSTEKFWPIVEDSLAYTRKDAAVDDSVAVYGTYLSRLAMTRLVYPEKYKHFRPTLPEIEKGIGIMVEEKKSHLPSGAKMAASIRLLLADSVEITGHGLDINMSEFVPETFLIPQVRSYR